jgi:hypothetical protein
MALGLPNKSCITIFTLIWMLCCSRNDIDDKSICTSLDRPSMSDLIIFSKYLDLVSNTEGFFLVVHHLFVTGDQTARGKKEREKTALCKTPRAEEMCERNKNSSPPLQRENLGRS